jgi:hypothetical protein
MSSSWPRSLVTRGVRLVVPVVTVLGSAFHLLIKANHAARGRMCRVQARRTCLGLTRQFDGQEFDW